MPYSDESDLKYIDSLDEIPVAGDFPDSTWSSNDKLSAAEDGESKLEADVNEGQELNTTENIHSEAAATWATYKLVLGTKSPDSATRGDAMDEGSERMAFADRIKEMYNDYIDSIVEAEHDTGTDSDGVDFMVADW